MDGICEPCVLLEFSQGLEYHGDILHRPILLPIWKAGLPPIDERV